MDLPGSQTIGTNIGELDSQNFWDLLDRLVEKCELVIDRPRSTAHPHYPNLIYPLDYGYLADTRTIDGGGIDVWLGSLGDRSLNALAITVDLDKRDAEIKIMLGCTPAEQHIIMDFLNGYSIRAALLQRHHELGWLRTRRSVRRFLDDPVPESVIRQILETACWAPSAHNRQPWRFAVLSSLEKRKTLAEAMGETFRRDLTKDGLSPAETVKQVARSTSRILNAPTAVVLCLDPTIGDEYPDPTRMQVEYLMGVQGVALAGAYLLLAAHASGLAGVWMCAPLFAEFEVRLALGLPATWKPQALILLGYPKVSPEPPARIPLDEIAIFE